MPELAGLSNKSGESLQFKTHLLMEELLMPALSERQLPLRIETIKSRDEIIKYDGMIIHRAICHFLFERLEVHTPNLSIL